MDAAQREEIRRVANTVDVSKWRLPDSSESDLLRRALAIDRSRKRLLSRTRAPLLGERHARPIGLARCEADGTARSAQ